MKTFYAIHVRTGYETNIASKLINLNSKLKAMYGVGEIYLPLDKTYMVDTEGAKFKEVNNLLFGNYVFVELNQLTPATFQFIRSLGNAVYTILQNPINETELKALHDDSVEVTVHTSNISEQIKKMHEALCRKASLTNRKIHLSSVNSKRSILKLPKETFINVAKWLNLTISDILKFPSRLIEGVLYYEATN